jgi:GNAT superfamily N-acetyltransferase
MPSPSPPSRSLPTLDVLVDAADAGLHPWVHQHVPDKVRRAALEEELAFWLHTAAQDMDYAKTYARDAPQSGQPPEAYLDRWIPLTSGGHVLAGPRYLGRNPDLPFVGITACDRPLVPGDRDSLVAVARDNFAPFKPGFVLLQTADPVGAWPGTGTEMRQVVGMLGDLRQGDTPPELAVRSRADTVFYGRYRDIHDTDLADNPAHARHARCEDEDDLLELAREGLLYDVEVYGHWAGVVAAKPDRRRGVRGATVVELILDPRYRGRGYGKYLSILLAKSVPLPDESCLMGTIHADNVASYRSALAAGRVDVGGEIRIPV